MTKEEREALELLATLRTAGWRVAEELLDAALVNIKEDAFAPSETVDQATVKTLQAQGAQKLVETWKNAIRAAATVEKAEPQAGLAQGA